MCIRADLPSTVIVWQHSDWFIAVPTLMDDVDKKKSYVCVRTGKIWEIGKVMYVSGQGKYGKSLYPPLDFTMNLKLFSNIDF